MGSPILGAGLEVLRLLDANRPGLSADEIATERKQAPSLARRVAVRLKARGCVTDTKDRPGTERTPGAGRATIYYQITEAGRQYLRTIDAVDESDEDVPWPRADPDQVVSAAVRTQPTSVFDLARAWRAA